MAETFFGVSMIPMKYNDEVRHIKSELLYFLRHPSGLELVGKFKNTFKYLML